MMPERKTFLPLTSNDICEAYQLLHNKALVSFPITPDAEFKIEALVTNINATYFGVAPYKTAEEKAVAYLYFIINDHPFVDGNKRTASLVFLIVCDINNLRPHFRYFTLDALAVFLEKVAEPHQEVIKAVADLLFAKS